MLTLENLQPNVWCFRLKHEKVSTIRLWLQIDFQRVRVRVTSYGSSDNPALCVSGRDTRVIQDTLELDLLTINDLYIWKESSILFGSKCRLQQKNMFMMVELGFKHFVGVDGSQGMLDQAAKTGLYKELKLALLGTEPLPAQTGAFDVVIIVGALDPGFAPVSVVRELCHAAKPGGLVCMSRGDHRGAAGLDYKKDLERELQLMQEEGLWSPVGLKHTDRYMEDPHLNTQRVQELQQDQRFISGTAYLYKKALIKI
uniref:Methyltransferase domain-containing protein n=1 Tax=Cyclopterus lumpus TaxID=8103 RepID=A0A8C2YZ55_CYCLU